MSEDQKSVGDGIAAAAFWLGAFGALIVWILVDNGVLK